MKITFIVPALNLSGGLRVVSIYAKLLAEKGHQVTVVSRNQRKPSFGEKLKSLLKWRGYTFKNTFNSSYFNDPLINVKLLDCFRPVEENDVPDGDIIIATYWNTAEWISGFSGCKGKKVYFIQGYEVHPWLPVERVKVTLQQPFKKIVVAQWIADILAREYDDSDTTVVSNGVDTQQFYASPRDKKTAPTAGIIYSSKTIKGFDTALKALEIAKTAIPNLELVVFSAEKKPETVALPTGTQFYFRPSQEELKKLYSCCDIWLFTSRSEGFGLPILEAMACRTPVIGTRVGAAPELINPHNGFLVEVDDAAAIAAALVEVARMPNDAWLQLSQNAYETALKHTWSESVNQFEQTLLDLTLSSRSN